MRLWGGVILRWFYFKNKTDFTHLPPPTHEPTRTERSVPRHVALWPGTKEHSRGHAVWTRLPTAMLGKSPITPPASSQACSPVLGLGVLFGADTGLRFLSLQPCFSSFCNYLSMKSSVIPHLQFVLHFSLGAGSSWLGCPEMCFELASFFCHPFHSFCIQTSPLALCAY